jgi:membrane associated rhomboid family serine protease
MRLVDAPWHGGGGSGRGVPAIIAACVAVYLVQVTGDIEVRYSMIGALVAGGETYRLLTSMFLHFGLMHLAMNMLATWIFGLEVERSEGAVRTVAAFLVTGLVGGATAYLFHPPFAQVAGASGGVFGLLGVALILTIRSGRSAQSFLGLLLVNLFIGVAVPNISLAAHAGGFVAGALYGAAASAPRAARPKVLSVIVLAAMLAGVAYVVTSMDPGAFA